jgi:ubiquinone/menaquinone biosynthesis C-methylase UbiE
MVELLNINREDTVLDLCTGTGSFLLEANKFNPKK